VVLPFLSDGAFPPVGALRAAVDDADRLDILERHWSLLHVAATRAKQALRVSCSSKPSALLHTASWMIARPARGRRCTLLRVLPGLAQAMRGIEA
jgi:hypothetical protein